MTTWTLILRSLRFHARSHLGALLGAVVGSAVLVGALIVGDSVRGSLRQMALQRLGKVDLALASGDRLFREQLGADIARVLGVRTAAGMQVRGTAANEDGSARANRVQVLGVGPDFWRLASITPGARVMEVPTDGVVLNQPLAAHLRVHPGDMVLLRVLKPSQLSRDAPLSPEEDASVALRLRVHAILSDAQFGRFNLQANQVAPFNAFLPLHALQQRIGATNRANLLLTDDPGATQTTRDSASMSSSAASSAVLAANAAIHKVWQLADAELELREVANARQLELRSRRVFLDPAVSRVALNVVTNTDTTGILTYLVNELRAGNRATPYSMVTAMENVGLLKARAWIERASLSAIRASPEKLKELWQTVSQMKDDEILINQWLADDLQVKPGDTLKMTFYVMGSARKLEEQSAQFKVLCVLPMVDYLGADRDLMPDFPGITDAQNCRDWNAGFPVRTDRIREKDEKYWHDYRGTPKAFVTLTVGQKMWTNRFGNLTAVRYNWQASLKEHAPLPIAPGGVAKEILSALDPASVGLSFQPVREQALKASAQGQDFGQLFLGFSFFLIGAALLLMALLFQFGIEQRAPEIGTLLALGFRPKHVRRILFAEGIALSFLGAVIGVLGGVFYAKAMLLGLSTIWHKAVGESALQYHAEPATLVIGAFAGTFVAVIVIWLALRKQARQPARELLAEGAEERALRIEEGAGRWSVAIALASGLGALGIVAFAFAADRTSGAELFFSAGGLLLIAGWALSAAILRRWLRQAANVPTWSDMALRNAARRRRRSLAVIALLACGSFLIASIGVFRLDANTDATKRPSGTGGFSYVGESSHGVFYDLNDESGREHYGLAAKDLAGVSFVQMRVREGDDASCLNLNRAQRPRLLAVKPELLNSRQAFTFVKVADGSAKDNPWLRLNQPQADGAVPAIGDAASIQWALGKKVGDTIDYTDEYGREFKIRIVGAVANSILQGNLIIAENDFVRLFPNESGYRMFLIDGPSNDTIAATLSRALQDAGFELTPATERLAAFNAVQNTYLNTFQVLGGLGLLLGSVGLGVVVLRNVLERRSELAVLLAVGFRRRTVRRLVVSEHGVLLLIGLGVGVLAALVAVLPALLAPGGGLPYVSLAVTLGAVLGSGAIWTWAAAALACRGRLLDALRNE